MCVCCTNDIFGGQWHNHQKGKTPSAAANYFHGIWHSCCVCVWVRVDVTNYDLSNILVSVTCGKTHHSVEINMCDYLEEYANIFLLHSNNKWWTLWNYEISWTENIKDINISLYHQKYWLLANWLHKINTIISTNC